MIVPMFEVKPNSKKTDQKFGSVNAHYGVDGRHGQQWASLRQLYRSSSLSSNSDSETVPEWPWKYEKILARLSIV